MRLGGFSVPFFRVGSGSLPILRFRNFNPPIAFDRCFSGLLSGKFSPVLALLKGGNLNLPTGGPARYPVNGAAPPCAGLIERIDAFADLLCGSTESIKLPRGLPCCGACGKQRLGFWQASVGGGNRLLKLLFFRR